MKAGSRRFVDKHLGSGDEGRGAPHSRGAARRVHFADEPHGSRRAQEAGEIDTIAGLAAPGGHRIEAGVANDTGVAFFNTFEAMGGEGTMARWYAAEPRLVGADFIHPMPAGAKIVGELLYNALRDGYNQYKLRQLNTMPKQTKP